MSKTQIKVIKRERQKVSLRLSGMQREVLEGISMTSEEAQCAANAIHRLTKDNLEVTHRFGKLTIVHFPGHHQPVELRFSDEDWSVTVDLSRIESLTIADMIRGAGVSSSVFEGEMDLQFAPRIKDMRRIPLPESLTSLLDPSSASLSDLADEDPAGPDAVQALPPPEAETQRRRDSRKA